MRTTAGVALIVVISALVTGVRASEPLEAIVRSYLDIQRQLAADKTEGIQKAARAIATEASGMGERGAPVAKAAAAVEDAPDIESARKAFGPLSDAVIAEARAQNWTGLDNVSVGYCSMAGQSWLQTEKTIRNPYYGSQMLECGEFKERASRLEPHPQSHLCRARGVRQEAA